MIQRVFSVGLLAGLFAGLAIAALQHVTTTPLIIAAEAYEKAGAEPNKSTLRSERNFIVPAVHRATTGTGKLILAHGTEDHAAGSADEWAPADGIERTAYTTMATIVTSIGFAFLLLGGMLLAGDVITERTALVWAIAGFVAMGLAPAAGLAPELPGSSAAELASRQTWWIGTALATALALWLFLRSENVWMRVAGIVLLLAPHIIGAPHPHVLESKVPSELSAQFAALSLAMQAMLWAATGFAVGQLWPRLAPKSSI